MKKKKKITKYRKRFSLKEQYKLSFRYLKESDAYILITFGLFIFLFASGMVFVYVAPPQILQQVTEFIQKWIKDILGQIEGLGFLGMFWFIFKNNVIIGLISVFSGFMFSIIPVFLLVVNAFSIGIITGILSFKENLLFVLVQLIPHGIFEIPAVVLSFALGIRFGTFVLKKNPWKTFKFYLKNSFRVFILIIIPLFIIAALIEAGLILFLTG